MPDHKPTGRVPQRSNGIKRREAIMDAAAEIISETGVAGLTLQATARRARSSIGSMYHFFSDKDELLDALRERHREDIAAIVASVSAIGADEWKEMSAREVIGAIFGGPIQYYFEHPFALQLLQVREGKAIDDFIAFVTAVMTVRLGAVRGRETARMLYAISTGTLSFSLDVRDTGHRELAAGIPAVLTAYLEAQERG
jgi:AcrR family transcriptional regulator